MGHSRGRFALGLVLALGCNADPPAPSTTATAEATTKSTAAPASSGSASANASAAPTSSASAQASAAGPEASSTAAASEPGAEASASPSASAVSSAAPTAKTVTAQPQAPVAATGLKEKLDALMAKAKKGVLPAGEADKVIKVGGAPLISILETGGEPRAKLRYQLQPNDKESLTLTSDMTMKMSAAGAGSQTMSLPQMSMTLDMKTAGAKESSGDMKLNGSLAAVSVGEAANPQEKRNVDAMRDALSSLKGLGITYYVNDKGWSRDIAITVPASASPQAKAMADQLKQSFETLMAPLPDDDIGEGGKWVVVTRVAGAADAIQWTTYTLKKRDGSRVEIAADSTQLAASGKMAGPGMPPGTNIDTFQSGGKGGSSSDLTKIFPDTGDVTTQSVAGISAGDKSMTIETTAKIKFTRK